MRHQQDHFLERAIGKDEVATRFAYGANVLVEARGITGLESQLLAMLGEEEAEVELPDSSSRIPTNLELRVVHNARKRTFIGDIQVDDSPDWLEDNVTEPTVATLESVVHSGLAV